MGNELKKIIQKSENLVACGCCETLIDEKESHDTDFYTNPLCKICFDNFNKSQKSEVSL